MPTGQAIAVRLSPLGDYLACIGAMAALVFQKTFCAGVLVYQFINPRIESGAIDIRSLQDQISGGYEVIVINPNSFFFTRITFTP